MGRPAKLNDSIREQVVTLAAQGWSAPKIVAHLYKTHRITVARSTIAELVKQSKAKVATERQRDIAAADATPAKTNRASLEAMAKRLERNIKLADEKNQPTLVAKLIESHRKVIDSLNKMIDAEMPEDEARWQGIASLVGLAFKKGSR